MTPAAAPAPTCRGHEAATTPDRVLVARIANGDSEAFEEIYRRHHRRALTQARKLCASPQQAEEIAQETFIALWRGAQQYRSARGNVSSWLSGMVRNRAIDAWRRAAARPREIQTREDGLNELRDETGADACAPERAAVLSLLAELPAGQKEALFLAFYGGLTHSEIAAHTDVPLGTIKSRIRIGLQRLRHGFDEQHVAACGEPAAARPALRLVPAPAVEAVRRRHAVGVLARTG